MCIRDRFRKGYLGQWSDELFEITSRLPTTPVTYDIRDLAGEPIKGRLYEAEIQKTIKRDDEADRVIKTRKRNGKIHYVERISKQIRLVG